LALQAVGSAHSSSDCSSVPTGAAEPFGKDFDTENGPSWSSFASLIVAAFSALFAEFREKPFSLLWRGSRDGFGARDFHSRCDGHAPTLALIQERPGQHFLALHAREVRVVRRIQGRLHQHQSESEEFCFLAREPA
jgi:hypothetical protein